jgi:hypothetical protein
MANMELVVKGGASFAKSLLQQLADVGISVGSPPVVWNRNGRLENVPTQAMRLTTGQSSETTCQVQTSDLEGAARGLANCRATLDLLIAGIVDRLVKA